MSGLLKRLFGGSSASEHIAGKDWQLWSGIKHGVLIKDPEVEKKIRAESKDPFYLRVTAVQNSIEVYFGSLYLGSMNEESTKYYLNGLKTLQRSGKTGLALGGIYRTKKHGDSIYLNIGMAREGFIPFNQPNTNFTSMAKSDELHPLVECKDEHKYVLNIRQFARENWSAPGWFIVNSSSENYEVFTYSSKSNRILTVGCINKAGQSIVDKWDYQGSQELLVKGFVTWHSTNPQVVLTVDGW